MHKMIHSSTKIISGRYNKTLLLLNIPSFTAASVLMFISNGIFGANHPPETAYSYFFLAAYLTAAYAFIVTLMVSMRATRCIRGHEKYSYIEITGRELILSEYTGTARIDGELVDYRRLWLINLSDVTEVRCTRTAITVTAPARRLEQRADRLNYSLDEFGNTDFDFWGYNSGDGEKFTCAKIRDNYVFAERIAQRIIFCSEKQKAAKLRREEFRKKMLETARLNKTAKRKNKKTQRVFRGYEIERKFY